MSTQRARPAGPSPLGSPLVVGVLVGAVGLGMVLGGAAELDSLIFHGRTLALGGANWMVAGFLGAAHPLHPAAGWPASAAGTMPGPLLYWFTVLAVGAAILAIAIPVYRWATSPVSASRPGRREGMATRADVNRTLGSRRVQRSAAVVQPSLAQKRPDVDAISIDLGRNCTTGQALRGTLEDSILVIGPPRCGKGSGLLIPNLARWRWSGRPGVVASTRPDLFAHTARLKGPGRVALWDPTGLAAWPERACWPIVRGCEDPDVALLRAQTLVTASTAGKGVTEGTYWAKRAEMVIRCLLHAAALSGADMRQVLRWVAMPTEREPVGILERHQGAAGGWSDTLGSVLTTGERERSSIYGQVSTSLAAFDSPSVVDAVAPGTGAVVIEPAQLLDQGTMVYLVGESASQRSAAPVIAAFIESLVWTARRRAARSPGGRLDPPLGVFLDEAAQIAPLPTLPQLIADGGGSGITTMVVLQSLAQARQRWADAGADAIWDAATLRLILGGLGRTEDLERIARLTPEVEDTVRSSTAGADGGQSHTQSVRHRTAFSAADIRELPPGRALLFARSTRVMQTAVEGWWTRAPYKGPVAAALREYEAILLAAHVHV